MSPVRELYHLKREALSNSCKTYIKAITSDIETLDDDTQLVQDESEHLEVKKSNDHNQMAQRQQVEAHNLTDFTSNLFNYPLHYKNLYEFFKQT